MPTGVLAIQEGRLVHISGSILICFYIPSGLLSARPSSLTGRNSISSPRASSPWQSVGPSQPRCSTSSMGSFMLSISSFVCPLFCSNFLLTRGMMSFFMDTSHYYPRWKHRLNLYKLKKVGWIIISFLSRRRSLPEMSTFSLELLWPSSCSFCPSLKSDSVWPISNLAIHGKESCSE